MTNKDFCPPTENWMTKPSVTPLHKPNQQKADPPPIRSEITPPPPHHTHLLLAVHLSLDRQKITHSHYPQIRLKGYMTCFLDIMWQFRLKWTNDQLILTLRVEIKALHHLVGQCGSKEEKKSKLDIAAISQTLWVWTLLCPSSATWTCLCLSERH